MKTIYDFGANDGTDIPYYLLKADRVIAVEANPALTRRLAEKFAAEIRRERLVIVNCALSDRDDGAPVDFYAHRRVSAYSQIVPPAAADADKFELIRVPGRKASGVVREFGDPHFIKVDVEFYDHMILRDLFANDIRPPFISSEVHSIDVFAQMVDSGRYNAFKLVVGKSMKHHYRNTQINTESGSIPYSFDGVTAGPFGDDVHGPWMGADEIFYQLAYERLGWMDLHATRLPVDSVNGGRRPRPMNLKQAARMFRAAMGRK